jgi:hypothetical protein
MIVRHSMTMAPMDEVMAEAGVYIPYVPSWFDMVEDEIMYKRLLRRMWFYVV